MIEQPEIVNLVPLLTPAQLAENAKFQQRLRDQLSGPRDSSPDEFARRVVADNLNILAILTDQFAAANDDNQQQAIASRAAAVKAETVMWLQNLGQFALAAELSAPGSRDKEILEAQLAAEQRDDGEWCDHSRWKTLEDGKNPLPNYYVEFDFYSPEKARRLSMMRCAECGFRNAFQTPEDFRKLRQLRTQLIESQTSEIPEKSRAAYLQSGKLVKSGDDINLAQTLSKIS